MSFTHLLVISCSFFCQLCGKERANCLQNIQTEQAQPYNTFLRASPKTSAIQGTTAERNKLRTKKQEKKVMSQKSEGVEVTRLVLFHYACKAIKSQMLTSAWHCATCAKADNNNPDRIGWWRPGWYLADNHKHTQEKIPSKIFTECDQSLFAWRISWFGLVMGRLRKLCTWNSRLLSENHLFNNINN